MSPKTKEEWEAEDIITELKAGIPEPGRSIPNVCAYHGSLAKGVIFLIRDRLDNIRGLRDSSGEISVSTDWKSILATAVKQTPWLGLVVFGCGALYLIGKAYGLIQ